MASQLRIRPMQIETSHQTRLSVAYLAETTSPAATPGSENFHKARPPSLSTRYYWRRKLININAGHASTPLTGSKPRT
jgi:hypothetical protein